MLRRFAFSALLLGGLFGLPLCGYAQNDDPSDSSSQEVPQQARWHETLGRQLAQQIASEDPAVQREALIHIIHFGRHGTSLRYGEKLNLDATVPRLMELFRESENEQIRVLALAGIHAIGDTGAMETVRRHVYQEESPHMLLVELAALMDFYGAKTFRNDELVAARAEELIRFFQQPRIEVGPLEVVPSDTLLQAPDNEPPGR